ncbi:integrase [Robbsia andropogonis]|uniref:hypothetical protein n=1 Tax=Robbsia andropogonis TaxID=28092 RepID=UPI003D1E4A9D
MAQTPDLKALLDSINPDNVRELTIHGLHVGNVKTGRIDFDSSTPERLLEDKQALIDLVQSLNVAAASLPPSVFETSLDTPIDPVAQIATTDAESVFLPKDPFPPRPSATSKTLAEAVRLYLDSKRGELAPSSQKDYANALALFVRWADGSTSLSECSWDRLRDYFEFLQWLPTNYEKRRRKDFEGLDAREFVSQAQTNGQRPVDVVSAQTRKQQQRILNGFFEWCREARLMTGDNPAAAQVKFSKAQRMKSNAGRGYLPFSSEELRALFEPSRFLAFAKGPDDFFLPLMGLYTGARMNELAQARIGDLRQSGNRWFLDIRPDHTGDDATETRVKTVSSVRSAPLHPDLIELGLIDYANALAQTGATRLFPHLPRDAKGKHTKGPSRRFAAYLTGLGIKNGPRKAFPSFRIALIQRLKLAGVAKDVRTEFVGHAARDVHDSVYSGQYGDEFLAAQTLDKASFSEVDVASLSQAKASRIVQFIETMKP